MKKIDDSLFDQRTVKKNIELGLITEEDYKTFLKSIPDDSEGADTVLLESLEEPLEIDEEDFDDLEGEDESTHDETTA